MARDSAYADSWIGDDDFFRGPAMDDDEMPAAERAAPMGNRRQGAVGNRVVRCFDATCVKAEAFRELREAQEIGAVILEPQCARPPCDIESAAIVGSDCRHSGETAVVVSTLPRERLL
jgi:hypothetical protein